MLSALISSRALPGSGGGMTAPNTSDASLGPLIAKDSPPPVLQRPRRMGTEFCLATFKPSSRTTLNGEQYTHGTTSARDVMSRHRVPNTAVVPNSWTLSAYSRYPFIR